jgi:hypothetical protein
MLLDREPPLAKPRTQWFDHSHALDRMLMEDFPLLWCGRARLVQNIGVDGDLSNVVQKCGPSQSIAVGLRESKLVGDEVGVGANAFGVSTGSAIMRTQSRYHRENRRGRLHRLAMARMIKPVHVAVKLAS